ncbi:hypothetical protein C2G38_2161410 [Gigaspora rosea]|uniref:Uncharacterized protein n=1 Tax=Gigaspora rosea TaxID=44941 RepID=A0A397VZ71_9GLOM|nr:hypothetical protein C2G38_2161410 [Gigaspora rosea]
MNLAADQRFSSPSISSLVLLSIVPHLHPENYEDIIKLLHKKQQVDKNNELNLAEDLTSFVTTISLSTLNF